MDPLLRKLDSVITRIEKKESLPAMEGKSKNRSEKQTEESAGVEWEMEFEDTGILLVNVLSVE